MRNAWNLAAFAWGLAEAALFFLVPDVILSLIALRRGASTGLVACLWSAIGAGVGGSIMYAWAASQPQAAIDAVLAVPAVSDMMLIGAQRDIASLGWVGAALLGPITSTPYKLYAVLAPQAGVNFLLFALASVIVRLPRFFVVSLGVWAVGRFLSRWLSPRTLLAVFVAAWTVFYAVFFARTPG